MKYSMNFVLGPVNTQYQMSAVVKPLAIERISLFLFNLACAGVGVGTLLIALTVRILVTYVCVLFAGFSVREKVFIALAWMPKATVQVRLC